MKTNPIPLQKFISKNNEFNVKLSLSNLIDAFGKQNCSVLRDAIVQESGYTKVNSAKGLISTADAGLEALESRAKAKKQNIKATEYAMK